MDLYCLCFRVKVCKVTKKDDYSKKPLEVLVKMMFKPYYLTEIRVRIIDSTCLI